MLVLPPVIENDGDGMLFDEIICDGAIVVVVVVAADDDAGSDANDDDDVALREDVGLDVGLSLVLLIPPDGTSLPLPLPPPLGIVYMIT